MNKNISLQQLLWVDGLAALFAGIVILLFSSTLSVFFNLPGNLLRTQAIVTLLYAAYSLKLANQKPPSKRMVFGLVIANSAYALFVIGLMLYFFRTASLYGTIYLLAEALFIGALAFLEWNKISKILQPRG